MFDFLDVVGSPSDGTVWASAVDTCTTKDSCNTVAAPGNDDDAGDSGVASRHARHRGQGGLRPEALRHGCRLQEEALLTRRRAGRALRGSPGRRPERVQDMAELPRGTVTFLFTDVEQSTRLLAELGADAYGNALEEHRSAPPQGLPRRARGGHAGRLALLRVRPRGRRRRRGGRRPASARRVAAPRPHGHPHGPAGDHGRRLRRARRAPRRAHLRGGARRPGRALADDAGPRRRRDARPRRASPQGPDAAAAAVPARRAGPGDASSRRCGRSRTGRRTCPRRRRRSSAAQPRSTRCRRCSPTTACAS